MTGDNGHDEPELRFPGAMILAAGLGTRLGTLTDERPKPMVHVGGRPVLEYVVRWLAAAGVTEIAVNLHHHPEVIQEHLGDGSDFGVRIRYSLEPELLGTAGGVLRMASMLQDQFIVVFGDVLTDLDLEALVAFHDTRSGAARATIAVHEVPDPTAAGIVQVGAESRIVRFVEKPLPTGALGNLGNAGVLVLDRRLLALIPEEYPADLGRDLFPAMLAGHYPLYAWDIPRDRFLVDIGTPAGLERAQNEWPLRFERWEAERVP